MDFLFPPQTGKSLRSFLTAIENKLAAHWVEKDILFPTRSARRLALIHEHTEILEQEATDNGFQLRVRSHPDTLGQIIHPAKT